MEWGRSSAGAAHGRVWLFDPPFLYVRIHGSKSAISATASVCRSRWWHSSGAFDSISFDSRSVFQQTNESIGICFWNLSAQTRHWRIDQSFDGWQKASQVEHEAIVQSLLEIQQKLSSLFLAQNVSSCSLDDSQEFKRENLSAEAPVETAPSVLEAGITNGSGILLPTLNGYVLLPEIYFYLFFLPRDFVCNLPSTWNSCCNM